jgi:hypothetical protein
MTSNNIYLSDTHGSEDLLGMSGFVFAWRIRFAYVHSIIGSEQVLAF